MNKRLLIILIVIVGLILYFQAFEGNSIIYNRAMTETQKNWIFKANLILINDTDPQKLILNSNLTFTEEMFFESYTTPYLLFWIDADNGTEIWGYYTPTVTYIDYTIQKKSFVQSWTFEIDFFNSTLPNEYIYLDNGNYSFWILLRFVDKKIPIEFNVFTESESIEILGDWFESGYIQKDNLTDAPFNSIFAFIAIIFLLKKRIRIR
jgi:hypothetical protein